MTISIAQKLSLPGFIIFSPNRIRDEESARSFGRVTFFLKLCIRPASFGQQQTQGLRTNPRAKDGCYATPPDRFPIAACSRTRLPSRPHRCLADRFVPLP